MYFKGLFFYLVMSSKYVWNDLKMNSGVNDPTRDTGHGLGLNWSLLTNCLCSVVNNLIKLLDIHNESKSKRVKTQTPIEVVYEKDLLTT